MEKLAKSFGEKFGYDGSDATHPVIQEWAELVAVYMTRYPNWHEVTEPKYPNGEKIGEAECFFFNLASQGSSVANR